MKITVVGDHNEEGLKNVTIEELFLAQGLKEKNGGDITLVLIGSELERYSEKLKNYDINRIVYIDDSRLQLYNQVLYTKSLVNYLESDSPDILIMPFTSIGMDLAPSVADALDIPVFPGCESVEFEDGKWTATRVIYGGKAKEKISVEGSKVMITVRPGDFGGAEEKPSSAELVKFTPTIDWESPNIRAVELVKPAQADVDITKYNIIVAVGRGLGSADNIQIAEDLAKQLNSVLACTRPVVDQGWLPKSRQVGTSGKTVTPKLYLAMGISGATNHINGMKRSGTIISINKDPSAAIFEISNYGAVADIIEVLPLLLEELKKG